MIAADDRLHLTPICHGGDLRPATLQDAAQLYAWRMDPETRRQSFQQGAIPEDTHRQWLEATLANPAIHVFIAEMWMMQGADGPQILVPFGMGRLDVHSPRQADISYIVAPDCRGQGLASRLISLLAARAGGLGYHQLRARVKAGNIASLRALQSAHFTISETIVEMAK